MNRLIILAALYALTHAATAQNPSGMSEADMQKMMQGMQEMQSCMEKVDQSAMKRLGEESKRLDGEIKSLCAAGTRDEAQKRIVEFGMKAAKDPAMKAMAECGKKTQGMTPLMPYADAEQDYSERHVCDD